MALRFFNFARKVNSSKFQLYTKLNLINENGSRWVGSSSSNLSVTATATVPGKGLKSSETTTKNQANQPQPGSGRKDQLDVSFNDPHAAFKSKTTFELIRAYVVYMLCSSSYLVEHNMQVRNSSLFQLEMSLCP